MSLHQSHCVVLALAGVWGVALLTGCGGGGQSTPEATFETAKAAATSGNWKGYYDCLTPESLDTMAGAMVMSGSALKAMSALPAFGGTGGADERKEMASKIDAVFAKHGVSAEALKSANPLQPPAATDIRALASAISDKSQFLADMRSALQSGETGKKGIEEEIAESKLEEVTITGDTASGTVVSGDKRHPMKFKQLNGAWKIDFSFMLPSPGKR